MNNFKNLENFRKKLKIFLDKVFKLVKIPADNSSFNFIYWG